MVLIDLVCKLKKYIDASIEIDEVFIWELFFQFPQAQISIVWSHSNAHGAIPFICKKFCLELEIVLLENKLCEVFVRSMWWDGCLFRKWSSAEHWFHVCNQIVTNFTVTRFTLEGKQWDWDSLSMKLDKNKPAILCL